MSTSNKSIAERAYELWQQRGCPDGSAEQDWFEAKHLTEQSAAAAPADSQGEDEASIESFPASDPPASHSLDVPPSIADEKWIARKGKKSDNNAD
jgi:hypothetical protein